MSRHEHKHDHGHDHDHGGDDHNKGHKHVHAPPDNNVAFAIGVTLNTGFVIAEVMYGLSSNSLALLSDAAHNLTDVFGLLIAWGAIHLGKTAPTKRRTYGLRRSSILAALTNAVVLLTVVGGITWEAITRFNHPEAIGADTVMWVAAAGIFINGISACLFMAGRKSDLNIKGAFLHMAGDAAISAGVVAAGFAIRATSWQWIDPAVSIVIGILIVWGTWGLLRESVNLALDAVPEGIELPAVESYLAGLPGVTSVHDLHIWGMSTTETALTVHLVMPIAPESDHFLGGICESLREKFSIDHVTIQVERGDGECRQAPAHVV